MTALAEADELVPSKKFRGVFFSTEADLWLAQVTTDDEQVVACGEFLEEEAAARAYDAQASELLEEPELNFPEE